MRTVRIMVDRTASDCDALAAALEGHLREVGDVVSFKRVEEEADPDELFGLVEVVGFVLVGTTILKLAKTAIDIAKGILEIREILRQREKPPLVVVIDGHRLALPATEADESSFLDDIQQLEDE